MMQRFLLLAILCGFSLGKANTANAQLYYEGKEYGISAGASQYFGDLNDNYGFSYVKPAAGVFVRFHTTPYIGIRTNLLYTHVGYDDKFNDNAYQKARNLKFESDVYEASVMAEFNFFRFSTGQDGRRFTPYLAGGIGVFYYNPYTTYNGRRYNLRSIGTEGQNSGYDDRRYSHFSVCVPIGAGVKYWLRPGLNIGFEVINRLTFTDYLDDVSNTYVGANRFPNPDPSVPNPAFFLQDPSIASGPAIGMEGKQRGNNQTKDQYLTFMVNVSIQLKTYRCPSYLKYDELY